MSPLFQRMLRMSSKDFHEDVAPAAVKRSESSRQRVTMPRPGLNEASISLWGMGSSSSPRSVISIWRIEPSGLKYM